MATLIIDLPETPQAQPAYRLAADCPHCGAPLVLRQVAEAQAESQRQLAAERATLDRTVRQLIALAHPDRWPDTPLAHELTVALVALRQTLQPGAKRLSSAGP